jgi:hypothetical protein
VSIKKQIKKLEHYEVTHRSGLERLGALVLVAATIFSLTELGNNERQRLTRTEAVLQPTAVLNSGAESEMERVPIKFDDGLIAQSHSGL